MKDQPFEQIKPTLEYLSKALGAQVGLVCLVHGFMPREVVVEKGYSTDVVDTLKELFPIQMNLYEESGPKRDLMASVLRQNNGVAYTIGEVKEGVMEEVKLYEAAKVFVGRLPTNFNGEGGIPQRPETEGEYRVRVKFNTAGSSLVNDIKIAGARLIDIINEMELGRELNEKDKQSLGRLKSLAMTAAEHAASDGVKAATVGL